MLTEKQKKFCEEYFKTKDAPTSALKAGYKPRQRWVTAKQLLANPKIQSFLSELEKKANPSLTKEYFIQLLRPLAEQESDIKIKLQATLALAKICGVMKESVGEDKPVFILKQIGYDNIEIPTE